MWSCRSFGFLESVHEAVALLDVRGLALFVAESDQVKGLSFDVRVGVEASLLELVAAALLVDGFNSLGFMVDESEFDRLQSASIVQRVLVPLKILKYGGQFAGAFLLELAKPSFEFISRFDLPHEKLIPKCNKFIEKRQELFRNRIVPTRVSVNSAMVRSRTRATPRSMGNAPSDWEGSR